MPSPSASYVYLDANNASSWTLNMEENYTSNQLVYILHTGPLNLSCGQKKCLSSCFSSAVVLYFSGSIIMHSLRIPLIKQRLPTFKNWKTFNTGIAEENKKKNRTSSVIPCELNTHFTCKNMRSVSVALTITSVALRWLQQSAAESWRRTEPRERPRWRLRNVLRWRQWGHCQVHQRLPHKCASFCSPPMWTGF